MKTMAVIRMNVSQIDVFHIIYTISRVGGLALSKSLMVTLESLKSAWAGSIVYLPGGSYGPRYQHDIQLVMLYTGEMNVNIDGRELHVKPGNVVLLKPGHEETFTFSKTEETWHRWIAVGIHQLDPSLIEHLYTLPEVIPLTEEMNKLIELMLNIQCYADAYDPALISLGMASIHLYPSVTVRIRQIQEKHPAVYKTLAWVRDHYSEELSLKDLASLSGVSPEHLVRLFKRSEGLPPIQYLWNYRITKATELLTNTGLTVNEIALRCGFKTSHHLSRLIKKSSGRTATEIRRVAFSGIMN